jgi:hypothetical protein
VNSGLPAGWCNIQDRFIAYLDTHAPLNVDGSVPKRVWEQERYSTEEMVRMLHQRFERFDNKVCSLLLSGNAWMTDLLTGE